MQRHELLDTLALCDAMIAMRVKNVSHFIKLRARVEAKLKALSKREAA